MPRTTSLLFIAFLSAVLLAFGANAQSVDFTGTWSGTYSGTKNCHNGVTHAESGPITAELLQTGSSVAGAITAVAPQYDDRCVQTATVSTVIPVGGTISGSTVTVPVNLEGTPGQLTLSVSGSSITFSLWA